MEQRGRLSQVIDDDDRYAEIGRQVPQQAYVCLEASSGAADANQWEILIHFNRFSARQQFAPADAFRQGRSYHSNRRVSAWHRPGPPAWLIVSDAIGL